MMIRSLSCIAKSLIFILMLSACSLSGSDDANRDVFGAWYQISGIDTDQPGPDERITGWYFSDDPSSEHSSLGTLHPLGVEGETGRLSLIGDAFLPSFRSQIHHIEDEYMIIDYFGYHSLATGSFPFYNTDGEGLKDFYLARDTVRYTVTPGKLFLDGRYYKGTWKRSEIGTEIADPVQAHFSVRVDGSEIRNLEVAEVRPTSFITLSTNNELTIRAAMGGKNVTISIPGFTGPGSYDIGAQQAYYSQFGFDTLSPSYTTGDDDPGTISIESIDGDHTRLQGTFSFKAYLDLGEESKDSIELTDGSFDLPVFVE